MIYSGLTAEQAEKIGSGRVLARVLAEDLRQVHGSGYPLDKTVKSVSCGTNCDEIVTDSAALADQ